MPQSTKAERASVAENRGEPGRTPAVEAARALHVVEDDLTIEDVSIDGMCGVY